jgi:hydroxymethylbilane synthase
VPGIPELRLGTRGSQLALWQAHAVAGRIEKHGGPRCRIVVIKTSGDRLQQAPLSQAGGKRLFVKEIEDALLKGDIDLAVHSSKDMPVTLPDGLTVAAVLPREDPLDAVVLPNGGEAVRLKADATVGDLRGVRLQPDLPVGVDDLTALLGESHAIGTSSVRRIAQLIRLWPNARFKPIRGNLDSRLRKLDQGEYDALVLAAAGLRRLGFESRISATLPAAACVPAPGQGIVAVETRVNDASTRQWLTAIDDEAAHVALDAERAVVGGLGGGCQTPIGALAVPVADDGVELLATVVALDGSRALRAQGRGAAHDVQALGRRVAADLLEQGAGEILADAGRAQGAVEGIQP